MECRSTLRSLPRDVGFRIRGGLQRLVARECDHDRQFRIECCRAIEVRLRQLDGRERLARDLA
jgi:hypothetical protein